MAGNEFRAMIDAVDAGDLATARAIHTKLIPAIDALMNTSQGAIMVKAALKEQGVIDSDAIRLPLLPADEAMYAVLRDGLTKAGLL